MLDSAIKDQLKGLLPNWKRTILLTSLSTLSTKVVPSWWTRWKKWLPVRINFPVGCRIVKG